MHLGIMRPGLTELLVIAAVVLLIFGTSRIGLVRNSMVKAVKNFKHSLKGDAKE